MTTSAPKRANAETVMRHAWDHAAFTASDLIAATGLTRSTVIGLCDDLVQLGWLAELPNARSAGTDYHKGRPARRYELRADAGIVVGVDAGPHRISAAVSDLRGVVRGRDARSVDPDGTPVAQRRATAEAVVDGALAAAACDASQVMCLTIGVSAPVNADGLSPEADVDFWQRMNPDYSALFAARGWPVIVENDANLAALAEGAWGAGRGYGSYVALVSGERFGAGYVLDGQLVRGARGGAGELHLLDLVEGVGSADGLGAVARRWASEAFASGRFPVDSRFPGATSGQFDAADIFEAARQGEPTAVEIVERLARRLGRICAVLAGLLDVERIIIAGAVAPSTDLLLERTRLQLAELTHAPAPEVVASDFGDRGVGIGAIVRSLSHVRDNAMWIKSSAAVAVG